MDSPRQTYANVVGHKANAQMSTKSTFNTNTSGIPRPRCVVLTLNDDDLGGDDPRSKITETDILEYVQHEVEIQGLFRVENKMYVTCKNDQSFIKLSEPSVKVD